MFDYKPKQEDGRLVGSSIIVNGSFYPVDDFAKVAGYDSSDDFFTSNPASAGKVDMSGVRISEPKEASLQSGFYSVFPKQEEVQEEVVEDVVEEVEAVPNLVGANYPIADIYKEYLKEA